MPRIRFPGKRLRNNTGESPMRSAHSSKHSVLRRLVMAGAVLATVGGVGATAARADDGYGYGRDGWRHEQARREALRHRAWREHEWRERHAYYGPRYYYPRDYAYAPRPVYPPPAYGYDYGYGYYR
jgi:hypothetical protein